MVAPLLVLLMAAGTSFALHVVQIELRNELIKLYPSIGRTADRPALLFAYKSGRRGPIEVDAGHREVRTLPPESIVSSWHPRAMGWRPLAFEMVKGRHRPFAGRYYRPMACSPQIVRCFITSDGYVEVVRESGDDEEIRDWGLPGTFRLGPAPGVTFALHAGPVGDWYSGRAFVGDSEGHGLWTADLGAQTPAFVPLSLPNGDRFVADHTVDVGGYNMPRTLRPPLVVRGERGTYVLNDEDKLVPAPDWIEKTVNDVATGRQQKFEAVFTGPLTITAQAFDPAGKPLLGHSYAPRTLAEQALAVIVVGSSIPRPPVLLPVSAAAGFKPERQASIRWFFDPFAALSSFWIFVANGILGLALAAHILLRFGRFPMPAARRIGWTVAVGLGGVAVYVCARSIESARAWRRVPALTPVPVPPLVLDAWGAGGFAAGAPSREGMGTL